MFGKFGKRCGPGGHHGRGGPLGHFGFDMLQDLDLTDEQIERIAELKADGMSEGMLMMAEGGKHFKLLIRELMNENLDKEKVKEAHKKLQEHKMKAGEQMVERALQFSEVLTPEQRKKLKRSAMRRFLHLDFDPRKSHEFGSGFGFGPGSGGPPRGPGPR